MNRLFFILSILCSLFVNNVIAQSNGELRLSKELLEKSSYHYEVDQYRFEHDHSERFISHEWKYSPGDNLEWKNPGINDSNWALLRTDFSLDSIPSNSWKGIGWFRLKLKVDSSLYNKSLALVLTHYGASEIYFDGKLINQYGIPAAEVSEEKTMRPPFGQPLVVGLDNKPEHVLALRYSFLEATRLFAKYGILVHILDQFGSPGFLLHVGTAKYAIDFYGESLTNNLFIALTTLCVLVVIGCFNFILYLFYSRDKMSLYMSISTFVLAGFTLTKFLPSYANIGLEPMIMNNLLITIFGSLWIPVLMIAYYSVYYAKLPGYVWSYFIISPVLAILWIYTFEFANNVAIWLILLSFLDMVRLYVQSGIKKETYNRILIAGVILCQLTLVIGFVHGILNINFYFIDYFLDFITLLSIPVALSIFNTIRTAKAYINQEQQLAEVIRLSKLSLDQEREKQQILSSQKDILNSQVEERTAELKQSLDNLKSTQSQLIQSEKMASLGEMTAGIAHEIQNPLNFVNNFSEVNAELAMELQEQIQNKNYGEVNRIAGEIISNEQKITHHGKRADSIVKNMLLHSRTSSGHKELTDINAMADEYLRLAYHGLRARDKDFNATIKTDIDNSIGKIKIIPQDVGRVLLNLYNNAFYAVMEKKKLSVDHYEPMVRLRTKKSNDYVEIIVKDNGTGIPKKVEEKIFQPFFTTKPAGEGTGLGLSLAYDIVKAHGGVIAVETKVGEGTEFIIQLPI